MEIALWLLCALVVFFTIRNIRLLRPAAWIGELFAVVIAALLLGGVATALDFGGWNELDWRTRISSPGSRRFSIAITIRKRSTLLSPSARSSCPQSKHTKLFVDNNEKLRMMGCVYEETS